MGGPGSGGNRNGGAKPKLENAPAVYVPPGVEGALAQMPDELSDDGKQVWQIVVPDLVASQVFQPSDTVMVIELCELLAEARQFRRRLKRLRERMARVEDAMADVEPGSEEYAELEKNETALDGSLKRARTGWLQMLQRAQSLAGEWGMSPVARIRLGLMQVQGHSLLDALRSMEDDEDDPPIITAEVL